MFARDTLLYWLDVEGVDGRVAARVVRLQVPLSRSDMEREFGSDYPAIQRAYDGLYCYRNDC